MWRVVVLAWPELSDRWRVAMRPVLDLVEQTDGDGWVVVDERCPGLEAETVRRLIEQAADGRARLGVRPVTDTVKRLRDGVVVGTVDRAGLVQVASPLVVPASSGEPVGRSLAAMAAGLGEVELVEVAVGGRRVADLDDLRLLEF